MRKTAKKILALVSGAVLLVAVSVMGTMAYLTDNDTVENTFTVGKVLITLDEADTDSDLNTDDNVTINGEVRDRANSYKLIPAVTYDKDPTIHVDASSEECYLFVKVINEISAIEATGEASIASQMKKNGWYPVEGVDNVYFYGKEENGNGVKAIANPNGGAVDKVVFSSFKIDENVKAEVLNTYAPNGETFKKIQVTAYAIQAAGLADTSVQVIWSKFGS